MTRFVILTTQRSGSTVLTRTLDEHPDIFCAGEIFHEFKTNIHHAEWYFPNWKITFVNAKPVLKKVSADNWKEEVKNYREIEDVFSKNNAEKYLIHS